MLGRTLGEQEAWKSLPGSFPSVESENGVQNVVVEAQAADQAVCRVECSGAAGHSMR